MSTDTVDAVTAVKHIAYAMCLTVIPWICIDVDSCCGFVEPCVTELRPRKCYGIQCMSNTVYVPGLSMRPYYLFKIP